MEINRPGIFALRVQGVGFGAQGFGGHRFFVTQLLGNNEGRIGQLKSLGDIDPNVLSYLIGDVGDNFGAKQRPVADKKLSTVALVGQSRQLFQEMLAIFGARRFRHLKPFFSKA